MEHVLLPVFAMNDFSVITFLDEILNQAIKEQATDIHFEPYENLYRVRFRIDGVLHIINTPPVHIAQQLSSRLKIMANLDIAEKRLPQDGRYSFHNRDIRVSTCPTLYGEKIVFRLLDSHENIRTIDNLGLLTPQKNMLIQSIEKPQGLILITGPTGSGKTVTLYAALNYLNSPDKNISTVEDPIEIQLPGINQVNINPKAGLDFAKILRSLLRQDPDVIMIGEIRDLETAQIALRAAQTGHLVLSTLHTNSAIESIHRLVNLGMSIYEVASTLSCISAQRLVRQLCQHCKRKSDYYYEATGCDHCISGYSGCIAIHETLLVDEYITELFLTKKSIKEINHFLDLNKIIKLKESGLEAVKKGLTSLKEIETYIG